MNKFGAKFTPETAAELGRLRTEGWSYSRLAARFNVSEACVAQRCRRMGLGAGTVPKKRPPSAGRRRPGYDGWDHCTRVSTSERIAVRAEHAAGAQVADLARKWGRNPKTIRRVVGLIPQESRTHVHHLFDYGRERTDFDRAVDEGLCALTPGYRRVVDMAEAEYARRRGK